MGKGQCKKDVMNKLDNELECRARELLAYLDTDLAVEENLPFAVGFLVDRLRYESLVTKGDYRNDQGEQRNSNCYPTANHRASIFAPIQFDHVFGLPICFGFREFTVGL